MRRSFEEERTAPRPPRPGASRNEPAAPPARGVVELPVRGNLVVVDGDAAGAQPDMHLPEPASSTAPPTALTYPSMLALTGMKSPPRVRSVGRRRGRAWALLRVVEVGLLLAALVIGGIEFKRRVLDLRWEAAVADEAAAVTRQRGVDWIRAVPVEVLPTDAYRVLLAERGLLDAGVAPNGAGSFEQSVAAWRALGLLEGNLDLAAVGEWAAAVMPVFYDGATRRIVMASGVGDEERAVSLHRALTLAALDQQFAWTDRLESSGPDIRAGIRGRVDGDALDIASVLTASSLDEQRTQMEAVAGSVPTGQQYPFELVTDRVALVVAGEFAGLRSLVARDAQVEGRVSTDASVLAGTLIGPSDAVDLAGAAGRSLGRLGWWYALAGRLPEEQALATARIIAGDTVEQLSGGCVRAQVWTATPDAATQLTAAFDAWAALAPAASGTTIRTLEVGSGVEVTSCDPGPDADTVTVGMITPPS